ncbi:MAG TPA: UDP-N-acetylmuramate--L-alanine ligase [Bacteroidia bacterium]|nr:UDP-N-acetylmuramate--L-alanine ligase [Bacteroidia bacterium]
MKLDQLTHIYFLGIGGIGMSALARFFHASGKQVSGYDKTATELTNELIAEGIGIHFEENIDMIPVQIREASDQKTVLIVWTPAVPVEHAELVWFRKNGFTVMKRAEVLGLIVGQTRTIAVAGTHGKSTTTTMTAHILRSGGIDCSAFLGGISRNYNTNLLLGKNLGKENIPMEQNIVVAEADEYDRSFLWLHPFIAIITSVDADHLDIYGDEKAMHTTYRDFVKQVIGKLITKPQVLKTLDLGKDDRVVSYSLENNQTDSFAENIRIEEGYYAFDLVINGSRISNLRLGLPGRHNVENAVAAVSAAKQIGVDDESVRKALTSFKGVKRRFDFRIRNSKVVFIDDYGHHPAELKACISSVRELFPGKKITGVFQPHLYSRTRDFADEFARSLELLDDVVLLDIYPAREKPIPGITSSMLLEKIRVKNKSLYSRTELVSKVIQHDFDVLVTMGAGDIDQLVEPLEKSLREKFQIKEVLS